MRVFIVNLLVTAMQVTADGTKNHSSPIQSSNLSPANIIPLGGDSFLSTFARRLCHESSMVRLDLSISCALMTGRRLRLATLKQSTCFTPPTPSRSSMRPRRDFSIAPFGRNAGCEESHPSVLVGARVHGRGCADPAALSVLRGSYL